MSKAKIPLVLLVLILLAAGSAAAMQSADAIQLQEQAAHGWHQTYEAYGRTVVVDIPVQVPDTEQFPVLSASFVQPASSVPDWEIVDVPLGFFRLDSHSPQAVSAAAKEVRDNPPAGMDVQPIYKEINELDLNTAYAYNNPATVQDAQVMMDAVWAKAFPGEQTVLTPYAAYATGEMRVYQRNMDAFSGDPWPYQGVLMVYFHQVIDGVPVLCRSEGCFSISEKIPDKFQMFPIGATAILQKLPDNTTMYYSAQSHYLLSKEAEVLVADLPLCGLDRVVKTLEDLIDKGLLRQVDSLQLGYAAWQTGDDTFTLVPTWALIGDIYPDAKTPTRVPHLNEYPPYPEHGIVLVNAQTGELIDPATVDIHKLY